LFRREGVDRIQGGVPAVVSSVLERVLALSDSEVAECLERGPVEREEGGGGRRRRGRGRRRS
jgi:hypothetical protein